ncbi:hypothetical protein WEN_02015 [Mycoplasma wenyonii str. Massachusetts]|uniref:Type I restriction modification DNA specificity domain-containing protein n=1 Tax=Mycoplasma wenyonii (strain Massachusetts) TaxID=1197325 RepID=I6ZF04_MYCWM|nr:restriction endonuclease subunit S [Mycoplasma wenyonii]AFN65192.1 hypothetical protein WEN_02015 [Mycoplasma wenyonii str. Massachusetts]
MRTKNKESIVTTIIGVDIKKQIKQVSLTGKTPNYELMQWVESGNFIMNGIHVDRDRKVPIALYEGSKKVLTSGTYFVFRVKNISLNKNYLNLLFQQEFLDKYSLWLAGKGIRGELAWKDFLKISISIPPLEVQEEIVNKYQTVTKYIEIKKRINELLERKMKAYFHILFDDLKDYETKNFGELFTIIRGGQPPKFNKYLKELYFCKEGGIPWLKVEDISEYKFVNHTSEQLTQEGFKKEGCKLITPKDLIFIRSAGRERAGNVYIISHNLTINESFWTLSNNLLVGGGINIDCL